MITTNKEFIDFMADDFKQWCVPTEFAQRLTVDKYELELGKLATDKRFNLRVGFYLGQMAPNATIPGTGVRSVRVDTGWPIVTVQQYNMQVSAYIPDTTQNDDGNENWITSLLDEIEQWVNTKSGTMITQTDGYVEYFVHAGFSQVRRLGNVVYTTVQILATRKTQRPYEQA
jgi:hypothetical protein